MGFANNDWKEQEHIHTYVLSAHSREGMMEGLTGLGGEWMGGPKKKKRIAHAIPRTVCTCNCCTHYSVCIVPSPSPSSHPPPPQGYVANLMTRE